MSIPGRRLKRTRLIQAEKYVVAVEVEDETCYEAETVQSLREVKERADQGDVAWLKKRGKVYAAVEAT